MLDDIKSKYEQYLADNNFQGEPARLYDSMNYIMEIGGKRIRPILTLLGAKISGGSMEKALPIAHAIEVFHNFTLVHDDIMDEAPTRRGKTSLHIKEDSSTAILAGDNMMIAAFEILLQSEVPNKIEILKTLSQTAREVCEGQQFDMDFENIQNVSLEEYIEMIKLKTAVLLGCSLKCGSLSANASSEIADSLYDFGVNTGIAFQIMDDYLDAFGNPELTGKQKGGDIIAAKKTILYHLAWQKSNEQQRNQLSTWFDKNKTDENQRLQNTMNLFEDLQIQKPGKDLMESYFNKAKTILEKSSVENYHPLIEIVDFLREREK